MKKLLYLMAAMLTACSSDNPLYLETSESAANQCL